MKNWQIQPSSIGGKCTLPTSKSQSIRALFFASLAKGESTLFDLLPSKDIETMANACRLIGANIEKKGSVWKVQGIGGQIKGSFGIIDAGNSGLVYRLFTALGALSPLPFVVTGDTSIRNRRPIAPLLEALRSLGCQSDSLSPLGGAPVFSKGPLKGNSCSILGQDSQLVTALLCMAAFSGQTLTLHVEEPGELPWVEMTLFWLKKMGIQFFKTKTGYSVVGKKEIPSFTYRAPKDFSSLAFPLVGALLSQRELCISGLDFSDPQGDQKLLHHLKSMGALLTIKKDTLFLAKGSTLMGTTLWIDDCIDTFPILCVLGCFAQGETRIRGASMAKHKESNRVAAMCQELKKMGAFIEPKEDGALIRSAPLQGAFVFSHHDHRVAMSLAVAAFHAKGSSRIEEVACVKKTFPKFKHLLEKMGGRIE